jgi:apolipoprotein N-acyltransferase
VYDVERDELSEPLNQVKQLSRYVPCMENQGELMILQERSDIVLAFAVRKRKLFLNPYLLTLVSGVLLLLSFPSFDFHFFIWFALVPFFCALANCRAGKHKKWGVVYRDAQLLGALVGIVFYYGSLYWIFNILGILAAFLISVLCLYVLIFAHILKFILKRARTGFALLYAPPLLWTAMEYFKSEGWWLKFSWMNLGYSQHNFLPTLQFAGILGQYGISFMIVLVNSAIASLIVHRKDKRMVTASLAVLGLSAGIMALVGACSLREHYAPNISVGLVQDESSDFSAYARITRQLDTATQFVLWPEYAVPEFLEEEPDLVNRLSELARQENSYLILGGKSRAQEYSSELRARLMKRRGYQTAEIDSILKFYNTAFLFSPDGRIVGKYHKTNPIQFFSDGVAGKTFPVFETEFGKVGILICYDADYSYVARRLAQNGAEMLFIPTYDAVHWSALQHKQHSAMSSMRAVENGRFVARATTSGISQIIDPKGRITQSLGIGETGVTTGSIQRIQGMTFYTRYGFVFPYVCIIASLLTSFLSVFKKPATPYLRLI